MASCSSLLTEEQLMCSICLDVFTKPVSTPCGHNYCQACITRYWDTKDPCQCPMCKTTFDKRPDLLVNTFISELAAQFRKSVPVKSPGGTGLRPGKRPAEHCAEPPAKRPAKHEVSCDFCTGVKLKALKSCLVCLTSLCETHLEPHLRVATLKKHKLIDPVENLEDRMCKKHDKLLELFCRKDKTSVCLMCMNTKHKNHYAVPLQQECEEWMKKRGKEVQQMIQERVEKVRQIKLSVKTSKRDSLKEISANVGVFTALLSSIQTSQAELIQVIEEKQKTTEKRADCFMQDLETEIAELKKTSSELMKLSHSEDHLHLLQSFPSLTTLPHTKDWPGIDVQSLLTVETLRVMSQLKDKLNIEMEKRLDSKTKKTRQYSVDVRLDPDTAHPNIILSRNGKQVRDGGVQKNLPDNLERFDCWVSVLGTHGLSGRFYYEVQVEGKTAWTLGVATKSSKRKGAILLSPKNGYWTILLRNGDQYEAAAGPSVVLPLREKPQKVGVFVDYEEGQVSFYNVETKSLIYCYTGCSFTEDLYPFFSPSLNYGGKNSAPLTITYVNC